MAIRVRMTHMMAHSARTIQYRRCQRRTVTLLICPLLAVAVAPFVVPRACFLVLPLSSPLNALQRAPLPFELPLLAQLPNPLLFLFPFRMPWVSPSYPLCPFPSKCSFSSHNHTRLIHLRSTLRRHTNIHTNTGQHAPPILLLPTVSFSDSVEARHRP